ncbi:MAG: hypothetical protein QM783_00475 [Phycisphaerales bacterium]
MNMHVFAIIAAAGLSAAAFAQPPMEKKPAEQPSTEPQPESKPAEKGPLSGPKLPDRTGKPTLVEHGADGKVKRLDEWPALAAVRKLPIDENAKKAIAKLEATQAAALDKMMTESLPEIAAIANAFQSGDTAEGLAGVRKLRLNHPVLDERELLAQRISALIGKEQGHELSLMVQEYWNALNQEAAGAAQSRGERTAANRVAMGEALRLLGQDIKASYDRVIGQQVHDFDVLIKSLGLTGEQESKVRAIVSDSFAKAGGNTSKVDKTAVFWKIWRELDTRQRAALADQFKGRVKKAG